MCNPARDAGRGREAVRLLEGEGLRPELLVLDVSSEQSVADAKQTLQQTHNRLDVLINNAGIFLPVSLLSAGVLCLLLVLVYRYQSDIYECEYIIEVSNAPLSFIHTLYRLIISLHSVRACPSGRLQVKL